RKRAELDLLGLAHRHHHLAHLAGEAVDIGFAGQLSERDAVDGRKPVFRRYDDDIALGVERDRAEVAAELFERIDHHDIKLAVAQTTADFSDAALLHRDLDALEIVLETGEKAGQAHMADGGEHTET